MNMVKVKHGPGSSLMRVLQLAEMQNMTAEELLKKYRIVVYSQADIGKINLGLSIIQKVLNRNSKKLSKEAQK